MMTETRADHSRRRGRAGNPALPALITDRRRLQGGRSDHRGRRGAIDAASHKPDLAIVDLGLPDFDGVEVIRRIREWSAIPILVLSARVQERSKIDALDAGADDYVTKPFGDRRTARARARRAAPLRVRRQRTRPC